jgi:arylsulfatase
MDRIANAGLRYTNFHSTSLCSPTRAALITGRNHHSMGFGVVASIGPLVHAVIDACRATGRAAQWPNGMGFDYFYGFVGRDVDGVPGLRLNNPN